MSKYSLSHLSDDELLRSTEEAEAERRANEAEMLPLLAEAEARQFYLPHGSMYAYCVDGLGMDEEVVSERIHAARAGRRFPEIFVAVKDGRLHLAAVVLIAPHLTPETVAELIDAATHKTETEIREWIARRFPQPAAGDVRTDSRP